MPPIRQLMMGSIFTVLLTYLAIMWIGGYQFANNIPVNATIASAYNAINLNPTNPNILYLQFGNYTSQGFITGNKLLQSTNYTQTTAPTLQGTAQFLTSIPFVFQAITGFVAPALSSAFGIPISFTTNALTLMLLLVLVLAVLSGLLIFPM
ncbi:MAG: hypothetical protein KGH64_00740 [Candidatus Micrarchaeota archaeon]|nr:hypothetical protein [Candidatus Micrarchaeota archaeon]